MTEGAMSEHDNLEELLTRWDESREQGRNVPVEELCPSSPELAGKLKKLIQRLQAMDWLDDPADKGTANSTGPGSCNRCGSSGLALRVSMLLAGRYRLEGLIASGGFGEVWRATDTTLMRPVAVKVTALECVAEARRVAQLQHPGIISVHDVGSEGGFCFIVFDLIDGDNLAERIKRDRLSWQESARIVATVADNLQYAHSKGFIHRDIKPANILLDAEGRPILADFGIAVTRSELQHESMTSTGTLAYMSPEQLTVAGNVDARTDVYSLGVVLYELLTGRLPFQGDSLARLRGQILFSQPAAVQNLNAVVPAALDGICMRCLSKVPDHRYATARDLACDLRELLSNE
jgi:serine/threonine protein kinase